VYLVTTQVRRQKEIRIRLTVLWNVLNSEMTSKNVREYDILQALDPRKKIATKSPLGTTSHAVSCHRKELVFRNRVRAGICIQALDSMLRTNTLPVISGMSFLHFIGFNRFV
jgi:hypothetical protein